MNNKSLKEYVPKVLEDQIPSFRILFSFLTLLIFGLAAFIGYCLVAHIPLPSIDSTLLALTVYCVSVGLMCCFIQINHIFASHLNELAALIENVAALLKQISEGLSHLLKLLLKLCRESLAYFLGVNPRKEISFFGRLSDLLSLAERPYPNAPLAFRS